MPTYDPNTMKPIGGGWIKWTPVNGHVSYFQAEHLTPPSGPQQTFYPLGGPMYPAPLPGQSGGALGPSGPYTVTDNQYHPALMGNGPQQLQNHPNAISNDAYAQAQAEADARANGTDAVSRWQQQNLAAQQANAGPRMVGGSNPQAVVDKALAAGYSPQSLDAAATGFGLPAPSVEAQKKADAAAAAAKGGTQGPALPDSIFGTGQGTQGVAAQLQAAQGNPALVDQIMKSLAAAQAEAKKANEDRYNELLGLYRGRQQVNQNSEDAMMKELAGLGKSQMTDIEERHTAAGGAAMQDLVNRGLSNSTVLSAVNRGVDRDKEKAVQALNEQLQRLRLGVEQQAMAAQSQLSGDMLGMMERRTDTYPDVGQMLQVLQSMGLSGAGLNNALGTLLGQPAGGAPGVPATGGVGGGTAPGLPATSGGTTPPVTQGGGTWFGGGTPSPAPATMPTASGGNQSLADWYQQQTGHAVGTGGPVGGFPTSASNRQPTPPYAVRSPMPGSSNGTPATPATPAAPTQINPMTGLPMNAPAAPAAGAGAPAAAASQSGGVAMSNRFTPADSRAPAAYRSPTPSPSAASPYAASTSPPPQSMATAPAAGGSPAGGAGFAPPSSYPPLPATTGSYGGPRPGAVAPNPTTSFSPYPPSYPGMKPSTYVQPKPVKPNTPSMIRRV